LYTELPHTYRQRLHAQVAAVLAEHATLENEPPTEQIAHHFALSQNHFAAALWLERAGDRAAAIHADTEAVTHYTAARQRLERHDRWTEGDHHQAMAERLQTKLEKLSYPVESRSTLPTQVPDRQGVTG
jgi:predicted ATPase